MNPEQIKGKWKQLKGPVRAKWGRLTDNDLEIINGDIEKLIGKLQELYGITKEEAQRQEEGWNQTFAAGIEERQAS